MTQTQLGEVIDTTGQYINRITKKGSVVNKTFVTVMEALGYDIELTYVKRRKSKMKVYVKPGSFNSDYFEVPDDITEEEANEIACNWVCDNTPGFLRRADGKLFEWEK